MDQNPISEFKLDRLKNKISFGIKCWLEFENDKNKNILGSGWAKLLENIEKPNKNGHHSLTKAAQECGYSYKYAWQKLRDLAKKTKREVVESHRGGYGGGGEMRVTKWGEHLIRIYSEVSNRVTAFTTELNEFLEDHICIE